MLSQKEKRRMLLFFFEVGGKCDEWRGEETSVVVALLVDGLQTKILSFSFAKEGKKVRFFLFIEGEGTVVIKLWCSGFRKPRTTVLSSSFLGWKLCSVVIVEGEVRASWRCLTNFSCFYS